MALVGMTPLDDSLAGVAEGHPRDDYLRPSANALLCLISYGTPGDVYELLARRLPEELPVDVLPERRHYERRERRRRLSGALGQAPDPRRRIRNPEGRRVGERRVPLRVVEGVSLPDWVQPHTEQLALVAPQPPSDLTREDADTARLLTRLQAGEDHALPALYARYYGRVRAYLARVLADDFEAEDAAHDVFVRVIEHAANFEFRGVPFRAWLFRVARNEAITLARMRQRIVLRGTELSQFPEQQASQAWRPLLSSDFRAELEPLPANQRQVMVLRYGLDMTGREVAAVLGPSPPAVRQLQQRAIRTLRRNESASV